MDQGPIIRRERWRGDAPDPADSADAGSAGADSAAGVAVDVGEEVESRPGVPVPLLAIGGLVIGLGVAVGGYVVLSGTDDNTSSTPSTKTAAETGDGSQEATGQEPQANAGPDRSADLEMAIRLWHLASLTQEEVNSLRQGVAASSGIEGTQAEEAMQIALSAKRRELTDRKTDLAEQLRQIGEYYQEESISLSEQVNRLIDRLRDERKDSSARWLELSRDWWDAMPASKPTAGYFRRKIDESL